MVYEKCYDPESIPTGARRMGGVPRGKEFAPEGQKLVANYIRRFFLLARLPDHLVCFSSGEAVAGTCDRLIQSLVLAG